MPISAKYLFIVSMDVDPEHEGLFNEVYDHEHIPYLMQVPGEQERSSVPEAAVAHLAAQLISQPQVIPSLVYAARVGLASGEEASR